MIFGGFLDTDLTNQCYIIDHNTQKISKMNKPIKTSIDVEGGVGNQSQVSVESFMNRNPSDRHQHSDSSASENNGNRQAGEDSEAQAEVSDNSVVMKKNKKFIKFKDFIIKLPNSIGLAGCKNLPSSNEAIPFVDPPCAMDRTLEMFQHPNQKLKEKGYSIYVVDDEHEIHKFDIDTYEWSIISTTKDQE